MSERLAAGERLLIAGGDRVGWVDWRIGEEQVVSLGPEYEFAGAAALGSGQACRAFGLSWHSKLGVLVASHEKVGRLGPSLEHLGFLDISPLWFMTHAIAVRDDELYTCNARIDVLGVHRLFDGSERFVDTGTGALVENPQHLKPLRSGYEHDRHHPNAVVVTDDRIHVLVHPIGDEGVRSEVRVFDRNSLAMVEGIVIDERPFGVPYAHDLAVVGDTFLWCDTYRSVVRCTDGHASAVLGDETLFLRGLAVSEDHVYVGVVSRRGCRSGVSQIVRLRLADLTEVDRRDVLFPVEVCAIRLADIPDAAHPGVANAPVRSPS